MEGPVAQRALMVERQLRARGIHSQEVLRVMGAIPRECFIRPGQEAEAYLDRPLPLSSGQTISQPFMVAAMTEALKLSGRDRVLEIGTGSGYQTAVLSQLVGELYSVERIPHLLETARETLIGLGIEDIHFKLGDGTLGWPEEAPFHAILVTAGAPRPLPSSLMAQLSTDGGRLVIPVGDRRVQELVRVTREGDEFREEELFPCRFVPLLGAEGWKTP